jgi:hypothetical protein
MINANLTFIILFGTLLLSKVKKGGQENRPDSSGDFILNNSLHPCHPASSGWSLLFWLWTQGCIFISSKINQGGFMPNPSLLRKLHTEVDAMVFALKEQLQFSTPRNFNRSKIKIYSEHLNYLLKQVEQQKIGGAR